MKRKLTLGGAAFALLVSAMFVTSPSKARTTADLAGDSGADCPYKQSVDCKGPNGIHFNAELVEKEVQSL